MLYFPSWYWSKVVWKYYLSKSTVYLTYFGCQLISCLLLFVVMLKICIVECFLIITLHVLFVCECILTKPMKLLLYLCPLSVNYQLTFGVQTNCQRYSRLCMYYSNIKVDKYILYFLTCGCHLFTILNTKVSLILWRENNIYGISNGEGTVLPRGTVCGVAMLFSGQTVINTQCTLGGGG